MRGRFGGGKEEKEGERPCRRPKRVKNDNKMRTKRKERTEARGEIME